MSAVITPPLSAELFAREPGLVWAMHCAEGPVPRRSIEALRGGLEWELQPWKVPFGEWERLPLRVKEAAARLLHGDAGNATIVSSTSAGLSAIARSFPWQQGDEVLAPLGEFPTNIWPWKALAGYGVSFREVPLWDGHRAGAQALTSSPPPLDVDPEDRLIAALGPRTRVLTVSWVRFQDGLTLDLVRLAQACAERKVALVIDGIQGAGTLPVELVGLAAFATGVHKGLLAPQGLGLLFTSPALREQLHPFGSWTSVEGGDDFTRPNTDHDRRWLTSGRKLEQGGNGLLLLLALEASLTLLCETGSGRIAAHVASLQRELLARLADTPFAREVDRHHGLLATGRGSSILSLHHGGRGAEWLGSLHKAGQQRGIHTTVREGYLRLALHGWHTLADIEQIADWLRAPAS